MLRRLRAAAKRPVSWIATIMSYVGIIVVLGFGVSIAGQVRSLSQDNQELTCATARLVAYVPAIQFEGEPLENFLGWLRSRRDMLEAAQEGLQCPPSTVRLLAERVRLDDAALEELEK